MRTKIFTICQLVDCTNKGRIKKGMCEKHYMRIYRHNDPNFTLRIRNRKCSIDGCENKHDCHGLCHVHYERKKYSENPMPKWNTIRSKDVTNAMNRVRRRDGYKCKWYGCNLGRDTIKIHVHHIFPRSEYPELELIEKYMICYCVYHHFLFHKYRGDMAGKLFQNIDKILELDRLVNTNLMM